MSIEDRNDPENEGTKKIEPAEQGKKTESVPIPERIGQFRISELLGEGGMGSVYKAFDESMKRTVALKVLHRSLSLSQSTQIRFAREAWIAGQLEHPNIIQVYSRGDDGGMSYFAMEFADAGSLASEIEQTRKRTEAGKDVSETANSEYIKVIALKFVELAGALEYIHSKGIIHRDIKPHNILASGKECRYKFGDFGIAHSDDMTKLTKAGDFMGTVHYMSPESLMAHRATIDYRTDIYSLGITLYEALTLSLPFEANSEEKLITEILMGRSIPPRKRNKKIPYDLETILMKATYQDPDQRYQSAHEMSIDMQRFLSGDTILASRTGIVMRVAKRVWKNKLVLATISILCLIVLCAGYYALEQLRRAEHSQRITTALERAIETSTSPFDFEPEWEKFSNILYRELKSGNPTDHVRLFLRANNIVDMKCPPFTIGLGPDLSIYSQGLLLFNDSLPYSGTLDSLNGDGGILATIVQEFEISVDDEPPKSLGIAFHSFLNSNEGWFTFEPLKELFGSLNNGSHDLKLRAISKYYLGGRSFINFAKTRYVNWSVVRRGNSLSMFKGVTPFGDSMFLPIVLLPIGDTLVAVNSGWDHRSRLVVLDPGSLKPIDFVFADTIVKMVSTVVVDEYPKDFPVRRVVESQRSWYNDSLEMKSICLIKFSDRYRTVFGGFPSSVLIGRPPIPVAARMLITGLLDDDTVKLGGLIVPTNGCTFYVVHDGRSYADNGIIGFGFMGAESENVELGTHRFSDLARLGQKRAEAILVPSVEVAQVPGDLYEFWGDTLRFEIDFQVQDSSLSEALRRRR